MAPAIPDRWLNYKPIGKRVEGTRFIAFKVPLRESVNAAVEEKKRLDGQILMDKIPNLGMIIDLTNTTRYYNPKFFQDKGIEYIKLMIPGHHTPPPHLVKQFKNLVISFLNKNSKNDKVIGVHCTHGVNRTGYLICNYMISELNMRPDKAIANFAVARGHKIERQNYLDSLNSLKVGKRPDYKNDRQRYIPSSTTRPTSNKEPISRRAPSASALSQELDRRNPFDRFRQENDMQRQRYKYANVTTPPQNQLPPPPPPPLQSLPGRRYTINNYNRSATNSSNYIDYNSASTNSSNYNSRYVNTSSNPFRGSANPYPYQHNNHHNQLTHVSDSYDAQPHDGRRRYESKIDSRMNRSEWRSGTSGERNYNRYRKDRRI